VGVDYYQLLCLVLMGICKYVNKDEIIGSRVLVVVLIVQMIERNIGIRDDRLQLFCLFDAMVLSIAYIMRK